MRPISTWYSRDFEANEIHRSMRIMMWLLQPTPLENTIWLASPVHIQTRLTDGPGILSALCDGDWNSSSSTISPIVSDDISGSGVTSPTALASTHSSTSEPPNSAMTTLCILWLAAWKLPMEMVGKPCKVLVLGCAFLLWSSRWKRQMTIVERLHEFDQTSAHPDVDSPVLNRQ